MAVVAIVVLVPLADFQLDLAQGVLGVLGDHIAMKVGFLVLAILSTAGAAGLGAYRFALSHGASSNEENPMETTSCNRARELLTALFMRGS